MATISSPLIRPPSVSTHELRNQSLTTGVAIDVQALPQVALHVP